MNKPMQMSKNLTQALRILSHMQHPSVSKLLEKRGYHYEAGIVAQVVTAFTNLEKKWKEQQK